MEFFENTDDLNPDLDKDGVTPEPPKSVIKPEDTVTDNLPTGKLFSVVDARGLEEDKEKVYARAKTVLDETNAVMPSLDTEFKIVTDKAVKVISLKQVEDTILANESICKSDVEKLNLVLEEAQIKTNRYTTIPTKVMYNETVKIMSNSFKLANEEVVVDSIASLNKTEQVLEHLLHNSLDSYIKLDTEFLKDITEDITKLCNIFEQAKNVNKFGCVDGFKVVNLLKDPIHVIAEASDRLIYDYTEDEELCNFKCGIKKLSEILKNDFVAALVKTGSTETDLCEVLRTDSVFVAASSIEGITIGELSAFMTSPARIDFINCVKENVEMTLNIVESDIVLITNNPAKAASFITTDVLDLKIKECTRMFEILSKLRDFNLAYKDVIEYLLHCNK